MYSFQNTPCVAACRAPLIWLFLAGCGAAVAGEGDQQYAAAAGSYAKRSWLSAVEAFDAFALQFPQHARVPDAQFFAAEALLQSKQYTQAGRRFADFIQRAPAHPFTPQARFRSAEALYLAGDTVGAARELAAFSEQHPNEALNAHALAYRAEIELSSGRFDKAAAIYRQSMKLFPDGPLQQETRFGLARTMEGLDRNDEAIQLYRSVAEQTRHPVARDAALRAGVLLYRRGDLDGAVQQLALFETKFSSSHPKHRDLQHEARYWTGMAAVAAGNFEDAVKIFETAARSAGSSNILPGLWFGLATATKAAGSAETAVEHHQRVVNEWPQSPWADNSLKALLEAAFEREDADLFDAYAAKFEAEIAGDDMAPQISQLLGREALRRGDYDMAVERFESLAADEPSDTFARTNKYYLSVAHLGRGQYNEALAAASSIATEPNADTLRRNVKKVQASALFELERYAEAAQLLTACLREQLSAAEAAECRARLAICQAQTGDIPALRETLGNMRRRDTDASVYLPTIGYLAELMAGSNETDLARELYSLLTLEGTPDEWVAKGLASLGRMQLERGETAESEQTFNRLLSKTAKTSEAPKAAMLRARALQQSEQLDAAAAAYRRIAEQYPETSQAADAQLAAAKLHDRLGQDREAVVLLRQLLQRSPAFEQRDDALYQLAWVLTDLQQGALAEATFAELLQTCPESTFRHDVLYRLAERAFAKDEMETAADRVNLLLSEEVEPLLLGHALYLQGQIAAKRLKWRETIPPMQRIVEELPDHALWLPANYWIAEAYFRTGNFDRAATELDGLSEATADAQDSWVPMVLLRSAQVAANQKRWLDTIELARSIAPRFPDFRLQHEADYMIGRGLSARGRFSEAREAFGRVVRSPVGSNTETAAMAQWMIGESFFHQKEYRYALRAYQRVISLHNYARWQSASLLQAGKCHEALGDWQAAVKCYAELIQHYPTSDFADAASARMRTARQQAASTSLR